MRPIPLTAAAVLLVVLALRDVGGRGRHVRDHEQEKKESADVRTERHGEAAAEARRAGRVRKLSDEKLRIRIRARFRYLGHVISGELD